jgi:sulfoxide reductase heme-binding subunit YedZ
MKSSRRRRVPLANAVVGGIAFGLMGLLVSQDVYGLKIAALESLQRDGTWKLATGALLVAFLAFQWTLAIVRMRAKSSAAAPLRWHRFVGALGPVLFYAHATRFGYAYLAALSGVFLGNILLGAAAPLFHRLHGGGTRPMAKVLATGWPIVHVAASVLTVVLTAVHAVLAAWYE